MNILVTGGAGYIGSHTIIELISKGHSVVVVDSLINSDRESIRRIEKISSTQLPFYPIDLRNKVALFDIFDQHAIDSVIHFAGLKAVGDSVKNPLLYYRENLEPTICLLEVMESRDVHQMIFSSSATVYGSAAIPYTESSSTGQEITSPYGQTKHMIEQIIRDVSNTHPDGVYTILRYFNPIGAHPSGIIGEDPKGVPNNLMPFISQVASGKREKLAVFGNDYDTPDGTCIRDYIHVVDLAKGHVAALNQQSPGVNTYNLGSGHGISVLDLINTFSSVNKINIPYSIEERRIGDLPIFYANPSKAFNELGWKTEKTIEQSCEDSWRWQSKNPNGYK